MDFLKELFEEGAITWEQFSAAVAEKGYKIADLSTGNYVARKKYTDDVESRDAQITGLTEQIATRDTDLKALKKQIEAAGADTTVADLTAQLTKLQGDYKTAKTDYETKLSKQSYEFAVREFANAQHFSSKAAKKTFIDDMVSAQLKMQNDAIMGASDFLTAYMAENSDSFVTETQPEPAPEPAEPKPMFVQPTPKQPTPEENPFNFNFSGVRAH